MNRFFDDNGWWGLAWVAAYDLTGESQYLEAARVIFARNLAGWDDVCGGGMWWNTRRTYKNAVTNELFITLAAQLHERTPGDQEYLSWALRGWEWLTGRALIGRSGLVNDGLRADCANNGGTAWTYNQGVILGGLAVLYDITGDRDYLRHGEFIADAALSRADRRRRHPDRAVRAHRRRLRRRRDPVQGHLRALPARVLPAQRQARLPPVPAGQRGLGLGQRAEPRRPVRAPLGRPVRPGRRQQAVVRAGGPHRRRGADQDGIRRGRH